MRFEVGALRNGLAELFALPDGYEILLGNGGTTCFWDAASFGLVQRAQPAPRASASSPRSSPRSPAARRTSATRRSSPPSPAPTRLRSPRTASTPTASPTTRPRPAWPCRSPGRRAPPPTTPSCSSTPPRPPAACGSTSRETDVYYFAPQKCLAADGGLWLAAVSPAAVERIEQIKASGRWVPAFLDLATAVEQSRLDQTYNTPALATILLANEQVDWMCQHGGLEWAASRCDRSAGIVYGWADAHELATPFVADPAMRSHVVATIDFDESVDANVIAKVLRANGIVDTESYRKLGRNQLRIALFPAIDPDDVAQLTKSIDHVVAALAYPHVAVRSCPFRARSDCSFAMRGRSAARTRWTTRPLVPDLDVPHLDHDEAGCLEASTALRVVRPVQERSVVALALHLDDHREPLVQEVDPSGPAGAADIDLATEGPQQRAAGDLREASLDPGGRRHPARRPALQELPSRNRAGPTLTAELQERRAQRGAAQEALRPRRLDSALGAAGRNAGKQLECGSLGPDDRDAIEHRDLRGRQVEDLVQLLTEAGRAPSDAAWSCHVHRSEIEAGKPPPCRCRRVRHEGTGPEVQHAAHQPRRLRDRCSGTPEEARSVRLPLAGREQPPDHLR